MERISCCCSTEQSSGQDSAGRRSSFVYFTVEVKRSQAFWWWSYDKWLPGELFQPCCWSFHLRANLPESFWKSLARGCSVGLPGLNVHHVDRGRAHSYCFWGGTAGSGHAVGAEWMFLAKAAVARLCLNEKKWRQTGVSPSDDPTKRKMQEAALSSAENCVALLMVIKKPCH